MSKLLNLSNVTLLGIDCIDADRLDRAIKICTESCSFGDVKLLTSLPSLSQYRVPIKHISTINEYSRFILEDIVNYVDTEYVLIVQYDGFILNPEVWTDDFFNYDYIGAPWYHLGQVRVGNGGFSLRSKKLLNEVKKLFLSENSDSYKQEDLWICDYARNQLENQGIHFAPNDVAKVFSFEGGIRQGLYWKGQFGFHSLKWTNIDLWDKYDERVLRKIKFKKHILRKLGFLGELFRIFLKYSGFYHLHIRNKKDFKKY